MMPSLKLPNPDELAEEISITADGESVSMPYGRAIALVDELISGNKLQQATNILNQISGQFPDDLIPMAQRLHVHVILKDFANVRMIADRIGPSALLDSVIAALCIRGYRQTGNTQEAMELALRAVESFPDDAVIRNETGLCFLASGNRDKAIESFDRAVSIDPGFIQAYFHRAPLTAGKLSEDQVDHMIRLSETPGMQPEQQAMLNFAIAWTFDRVEPDRHFKYLHKANALIAAIRPWDERSEDRRLEKTKAYFSADFVKRAKSAFKGDLSPIFIIGLPRSGTSLVEQILSTHDAVMPAGETGGMSLAIENTLISNRIPSSIVDWPNDVRIERYGAQIDGAYRKRIAFFCPEGSLFTDKSIGNEWWCGLVLSIYPEAKIIHCHRQPLDSCLSMYQLHFTEGQAFAYNLGSLARHYRRHTALMDHWKRLFPESIHSISYEELIENPRENIERLLGFCDLPWQERCMNFHEQERIARTASNYQVKQPLYRNSVNRWIPYAGYLKEVADILSIDISSRLSES